MSQHHRIHSIRDILWKDINDEEPPFGENLLLELHSGGIYEGRRRVFLEGNPNIFDYYRMNNNGVTLNKININRWKKID